MSGLPLGDAPKFRLSIDEIVNDLEVECNYRIRVYGRQIRDGKRQQYQSERKLAMVRAAIKFLRENGLGKTVTVDHEKIPIPPPE